MENSNVVIAENSAKAKKCFNIKKYRIFVTKLAIFACTLAMAVCNASIAFAANEENTSPDGVGGTTTMNNMIDIVFWVVRILVLLIGGVPGVIKIVQGQADENPRDRNAGLATIGITGAVFAATFAIKSLI